jgi:hypothetical protein
MEVIMTKKDAIALEALCEKWLSEMLGDEVEISMVLTGRLKVRLKNGDYITIDKNFIEPSYCCWCGYYTDLVNTISKIIQCFQVHEVDFRQLAWSYENRSLLREDEE